jgi:hypothetical protein
MAIGPQVARDQKAQEIAPLQRLVGRVAVESVLLGELRVRLLVVA